MSMTGTRQATMNVMKTTLFLIVLTLISSPAFADGWKDDPIWHDPTMLVFDPRALAWVDLDRKAELDPYLSGRPPKSTETVQVTYPFNTLVNWMYVPSSLSLQRTVVMRMIR